MLAGGLLETVPVGVESGDPCLVVPVDLKITTAGSVLNDNAMVCSLADCLKPYLLVDEGGDHYLVVPVAKDITAGAVLGHSEFSGGLLEAVPVGGDHYLVVPVDVKVATDRAAFFYHLQSYSIAFYSS